MSSACGVHVGGRGALVNCLIFCLLDAGRYTINTESNITTALDDQDKDKLQNLPDYETVLLDIADASTLWECGSSCT
jgi:hypothetical protein